MYRSELALWLSLLLIVWLSPQTTGKPIDLAIIIVNESISDVLRPGTRVFGSYSDTKTWKESGVL